MKTFINKTGELRCVEFEDGTAQFLMRGQKFTSDKPVKKVQQGIVVKEVEEPTKTASVKKTDTKD